VSNNMKNNIINRNSISILVIILITAALATWILMPGNDSHNSGEAHNDGHGHEEEEVIKGPHGGRLLVSENADDKFSLEITIFETGLPPEFRVYAYHDNQPAAPDEVNLVIDLSRLGNKVDHIEFSPQQDYLRGNVVVYEPHSFEVAAKATYQGKTWSWHYDNFEGRTRIAEKMANEMGIQVETVGPVTLDQTRTLTGRVQVNPNKLSRVRPRFPGVVKKIRHELGDVIRAGDVLATVQSNESLQDYDVRAAIDGQIIKRDIQVGEATGDEALFIIADLSDVWVELDIFVRDLALVKKGRPVLVDTLDGDYQKTAIIDWVSPLTAHASQSVRARVIVDNKDGVLRPGQFVRGHVTVAEHAVPLAVRQSAIQRFRDFQVVFARFDDNYEVRMLELGRRNGEWVEVLDGIEPGTNYVTGNSYLIKADIEKSGASHDH
jgi:cobalt-zinc-cadmium efflux system membrane fusion protein